ncbi:MAG: ATP-dependent Clp protease ATP-binding subunit [Proteobacteria bacterium]|nr:ATP-dependent Clp protease ATP-binding subunit [Pseudomonadota bacterium]
MAAPSDYERALEQLFSQAQVIAERCAQPLCSGHLLLALLGSDALAGPLLHDRGLGGAEVAGKLTGDLAGSEPADWTEQVRQRCRQLARAKLAAPQVGLHALLALAGARDGVAARLLTACGLDLPQLRSIALALVTNPQRAPTTPRVRRRERTRNDPRVTRRLAATDAPESATLAPTAAAAPAAAAPYALDAKRFPILTQLGRNLSAAAAHGEIEALIGRRALVQQLLDVLGKRRANNPCLVGEPGVGKTALVEGLAYLQVHEPEAVPQLAGRCLVELNVGALVAGTQLRGAFSERVAGLRQEVEAAAGQVVLFLDDIHTLVGAGAAGDGALDAVGELSGALAQGNFPCIGATSTDNFRRVIEPQPTLKRRLQPILVPEPTLDETVAILRALGPAYARHHGIALLDEAYPAAAELAQRYLTDRQLPDKAIALLDLAGSRARRSAEKSVGRAQIAELVAEAAGVPVQRLLLQDNERLLQMETFLQQRIVGHQAILERIGQVLRRNYAGFRSQRPIGSFLLLGPTGVGKTELVKALADFMFQSREALCRFDMSEYMEPHNVARLIGSPPGYVGYEQGGQLTEAIRRRPYQIVLLDEVEKAHRDVLQLLLQLLDDGRLTDGRGRTVDFSNTLVVMTSNLGSEHYERRPGGIGFAPAPNDAAPAAVKDNDPLASAVLQSARRALPIELWNRIEERLVFRALTRQQIRSVARLLVEDSSRRLLQERKVAITASEAALDYLIDHGGYDALLGARPMRTTIQRLIEGPVAELILAGGVVAGDTLAADVAEDALTIRQGSR